MNTQENEPNSAQITTSNEDNAAGAANENSESDVSEEDSLVDYNEVDDTADAAAEAERRAAEQKALREMLANNGFALRNILRLNEVKAHFTSPFSKENTMSPEDILSELPKEELHEVGAVQNRIFMPISIFRAKVDNSHNQSAQRPKQSRHSIARRF
jgi:hypothetical protein